MKTTEVRLGNLVAYKDHYQSPEVVAALNKESEKINGHDAKDFNGIPLTEQWLEDFGFEKVQDNVWRLEIAPDAHIELIKSHDFFYPVLSNSPEFSHEDLSVVPVNRLYSVHWLQNLVYFNYEKELELKKAVT